MTNQEQYERVWSKAENYDRLKEQVLTSEKVYEGHIKRLEAENAELKRLAGELANVAEVLCDSLCDSPCGCDVCPFNDTREDVDEDCELFCLIGEIEKFRGGMENG